VVFSFQLLIDMSAETSLVTGLGDEVLAVLTALFLGGLLVLVWWSTHVRERPRVRAVLLQPLRPGVVLAEQITEPERAERAREEGRQVVFAEGSPTPPIIQGETEEGPSQAEEDQVAAEGAASAQVEDKDLPEEQEEVDDDGQAITIRLKFLNDSQREVRAAPTESLGRFRRRHFASDLADNKTVKLIFNGHLLSGDQRSLDSVGLKDNCVVHCLVSQPERASEGQGQSQAGASQPGGGQNWTHDHEDNLDLSHICYPMLGAVLLSLWWCQVVYAHYFSLMSSVSLITLTVVYMASIVNTYIY